MRKFLEMLEEAQLPESLIVPAEAICCDRCGKPISDFVADELCTGGFYLREWDPRFFRLGEDYVCDHCMWTDPAYVRIYGNVLYQ